MFIRFILRVAYVQCVSHSEIMDHYMCFAFILLFIPYTISDTDSDIGQCNDATEITNLKNADLVIKQEIYNERRSRISMDKEITTLTRQYRDLIVEHSNMKIEYEELKRNLSRNLISTTDSYDALTLANNNKFASLLQIVVDIDNVISSFAIDLSKSGCGDQRIFVSKLKSKMQEFRETINKSNATGNIEDDIRSVFQFINQTRSNLLNQESINAKVEETVDFLHNQLTNLTMIFGSLRCDMRNSLSQMQEQISSLNTTLQDRTPSQERGDIPDIPLTYKGMY